MKKGLDLVAERARLTRAQTEKTEVELARLRGELIPIEDVEIVLAELVSVARAKLLQLPMKLAAAFKGATTPGGRSHHAGE